MIQKYVNKNGRKKEKTKEFKINQQRALKKHMKCGKERKMFENKRNYNK